MNLKRCWSADFETTTDENDCRVWAYSLSNIEEPEKFLYGNSIDKFMEWCANPKENYTLYFFNLKFDSAFILSWLLKNGFRHLDQDEDKQSNTFNTLITDSGQFFTIDIYFEVKKRHINKVRIVDAAKIFPNFSVSKLAKGFGLPISKLTLDYNAYRAIGHELTQDEIDYIRNDVEIVARCLKVMFERGLTKITAASNAMSNFKDHFKYFRHYFPRLEDEVDAEIRKSYKGGFTYVSDKYKGVTLGKGVTLDVNSLYPSIMRNELMPYGQPVLFDGKYQHDSLYPLYIQVITCSFEIKPDKIPTIQIKHSLDFQGNEYLTTSNNEILTLSLTKPDFELFMKHYNVYNLEYVGGFKFKAHRGFFDDYIDYWMAEKVEAGKQHNAAKKQIAKLQLNSLYGKFGLSTSCAKKIPVLDHNGELAFQLLPRESREPVYIPVASFVTAYGRTKTISTSQKIREYSEAKYGRDAYVYSDTDSIKALLTDDDIEELKSKGIIEIDDFEIGKWALEEHFDRILAIRQKCYIVEVDGKVHPTVAGLPKYLAPLITFDNFKRGFTTAGMELEDMLIEAKRNNATEEELEQIHHKLTYKYVDGGVILVDTDFTIK